MSDALESRSRTRHAGAGNAAGSRASMPAPSARRAPLQAWRAWSGCGDGRQVHLIIDPRAQQVWLLPAEDAARPSRSVR